MVHWTDFERLRRELATGNFRPEHIALPGAFTPQAPAAQAPSVVTHASTPPTAPAKSPPRGGGRKIQTASHTQNPWTADHLKVAPGFRIRCAIDTAADVGTGMPETNDTVGTLL